MAAKGTEAKKIVTKTIQEAFGSNYIGEYNNKIYVWAKENGEMLQIAISLTCPKVQVEVMPSANSGGDYNFDDDAGTTSVAPTAFVPAEITQEEKDNIATLMERLGL